ncbi:MAG: 4-hydroxybenzoate 3-monooxygenase [Rhodospirillales bacterium]|nr:4-hydroxybenzoate 3-monooxygenase [Acetobacter sp.]
MAPIQKETAVVIIGAGVAGLTLATFLQKGGVPCIVLERRSREHVAVRQRAGVVEARGVRMFERRGLADKLLAGPVANTVEYRVNGVGRVFEVTSEDGSPSRFCTQQMLVNNLLKLLVDELTADVRFDANVVAIYNEDESRPRVRYTNGSGTQEIVCDYIAGCDADHGVSRAAIPDGVLKTYAHEFGYAWLAALVEAPVTGHALMAVSDEGFAAQLPRGPQRSRYYLQCALTDGPSDWPDKRVWNEIRLRMGDPNLRDAPILDKLFVPLRSVVYTPMQYRNLFLAGDAAHLVPPTGAKGMNLALYDVDVLAQALVTAVHDGDRTALDGYTEACLPRIWRYQEFSAWMTDTMHDAGDPTLHGEFRQRMARARLDTLFQSQTAGRLHAEFQQGIVQEESALDPEDAP